MRITCLQNLHNIRNQFVSLQYRSVLKENTVNETIYQEMLIQLLKAGFSFVFIIDGFDKIKNTTRFKEKFLHLRQELKKLFSLDTRLGGCYLLITRNETIKYFEGSNNYQLQGPDANRHSYQLKVIPFESIFNKRKNIIIEKGKIRFPNYDFQTNLDEFAAYLWKTADVKAFDKFIEQIDQIYHNNQRAKIQFIQLLYYDFLKSKKFHRGYQLVESMCLAGYNYPQSIYNYVSDGNNLNHDLEVKIFDNIFIPIIFRFPYHEDYMWKTEPIAHTYILAGIRIIQLLHAFQYIRDIPSFTYQVPFHFIKNNLEQLFQYEETIIDLILNELAEAGLIVLVGASLYAPNNSGNYKIETTPKLHILYSNRLQRFNNIFGNIAYLNMCAMRTLVNINVIHSSCEMPYFKAMSLYDDNTSTTQWAINKILNSISLYRILRFVDEKEINYAESINKTAEGAQVLQYIKDDNFINELKNSILRQSFFMVNSFKSSELKKLKKKLDHYKSYLCTNSYLEEILAEQ